MSANHQYAGIYSGRYINAKFVGHTYLEYLNFLKKCGCQRQIVASNVRVIFYPDSFNICVRLYDTDIICFMPDGTFWADAAHWGTQTTTTRMSQFGPYGVSFWRYNNRVWCNRGPVGREHVYPVEKEADAVEYEEPNPCIMPAPLKRRRRTIRIRSEV